MTIEFDQLEPTVPTGHGAGVGGRRRILAVVAAMMLVAAAAGAGYGIGRNVDSASTNSAASQEGDAATASAEESPSTPTTTESRAQPLTADSADDAESSDWLAAADGDFAAGEIGSSGSMGYPAFGTQPMETLFERVTDAGFALRAQLGEMWDNYFEEDWMDGDPQWVVVVQAPADVTTVRIAFADGSSDAVTPQNGVALLTGPGEFSTPVDDGDHTYWIGPTAEFEVTFEGGAEPVTLTADGVGTWDDPEFRESCTPPPPPLPEAGEQPADPAAAEAEVRALMATLYGIVGSADVRSDLIDDPTGVAEAREQVEAGGYAEDAAGAVATVDELVFTAPDEAWFRYSIDTPGIDLYDRYGIAVVVDGVWKITRDTVCQDLSAAGGDCGGGWQSIYPPGAFPEMEQQYPD